MLLHNDIVSQIILKIIEKTSQPLETVELISLVDKEVKVSRAIIRKRLDSLLGDGRINGRLIGSGKGVWVWWKKESFSESEEKTALSEDDAQKVVSVVDSSGIPLETKDIESKLPGLSRVKILHRLTTIWGDGAIEGKQVGSGKGVWIWWRADAFEK